MAAGSNIQTLLAGITATVLSSLYIFPLFSSSGKANEAPGLVKSFLLFFYSCFVKPHQGGTKGTQQDALESFYKKQAGAYDATRKVLLRGREDMLSLVAAQLQAKANGTVAGDGKTKRIWVDVRLREIPACLFTNRIITQIGGGTGFNIEAMSQFVNVSEFFSSVYLVDFSPSLCDVAKKRFERLGWTNVHVVCEDARKFRLEDYEPGMPSAPNPLRSPMLSYFAKPRPEHGGADLITMSYSLSMIVSLIISQYQLLLDDKYSNVTVCVSSLTTTPWLTVSPRFFLPRALWAWWISTSRTKVTSPSATTPAVSSIDMSTSSPEAFGVRGLILIELVLSQAVETTLSTSLAPF